MSRNKNRQTSHNAVLDVVILTAGRFDLLGKCLNALRGEAKSVPLNVILIDDFSDPEERIANDKLFDSDMYPEFTLFTKRFQENLGFPIPCNEGARMGKASYIMFLNDDVVLQEGAISKVMEEISKPDVGVVGIKLLFPPDSTERGRPAGRVQHVGLAANIRGDVIHPLIGWSPDNPKCCISREVSFVTGACLTTTRELFNKVGGFDKIYGLGTYEDAEYCLRMKQLGRKIYLRADAIGFHYTGSTASKRNTPFPLALNSTIFKTRWTSTGLIAWDEWMFW